MSTDNQSRRYNFRRLRPGISSPTRGAIYRLGEQPDDPGRVVSPDVSDAEGWDESHQADTAEGSSLTELKDDQEKSPSQDREYSHQIGEGQSAEESSPVDPSGESPGHQDERNEPGSRPHDTCVAEKDTGNRQGKSQEGGTGPPLTQEQTETIELARRNLTTEQNDLVEKRNKTLNIHQKADKRSRERRTLNRKDKGIDPREWGQLDANNDIELNPETQRKLLKNFEQRRKEPFSSDSEMDSDYEPGSEESDDDDEPEEDLEKTNNEFDRKTEKNKITELENQLRRLRKEIELEKAKNRDKAH
ncbi:hypothetical protein C0992_005294 [Termitomyces sp. T32_za158]|nr:hypothetical protein C0992_005294 [Termitomyces sp. T32_za158]